MCAFLTSSGLHGMHFITWSLVHHHYAGGAECTCTAIGGNITENFRHCRDNPCTIEAGHICSVRGRWLTRVVRVTLVDSGGSKSKNVSTLSNTNVVDIFSLT